MEKESRKFLKFLLRIEMDQPGWQIMICQPTRQMAPVFSIAEITQNHTIPHCSDPCKDNFAPDDPRRSTCQVVTPCCVQDPAPRVLRTKTAMCVPGPVWLVLCRLSGGVAAMPGPWPVEDNEEFQRGGECNT